MTDYADQLDRGTRETNKHVRAAVTTIRQQQVLALMAEHRRAWGRPPTLTEIGYRLGIGKQAVAEHVEALKRKGLIPDETSSIANQEKRTDTVSDN